MSLRARLIWLALLATLLPALLVGWRFVRDSEAEVAAALKSLAGAADGLAIDLNHRVQGTAQLSYGLARSGLLDTTDREACSAYLSEVREEYPQYTGMVTALPDGRLFCDSLRSGREVNLADRLYFKQVTAGAGMTLAPAFGRLTGKAVLQIVSPARSREGRLRFMLIASLDLQKFAQDSLPKTLQSAPELLIVDHGGTVMAWAGPGVSSYKPGDSLAGTALLAMAETQGRGPNVAGVDELTDPQGNTKVWTIADHPAARSAGLHLMLGLPRSDLVATAQSRLRQDLLALCGAAIVLFALAWLLAEWGIRRQMGRITTMVRALGSGDLSARIPTPYPRGELGGLMAVLNSTAASLEGQRAAIEELGLKLRQAQKLEAIGTLAGGIAHDFNNILGAILGNLAIAQDEVAAGQSPQTSLEQIRRAALRARDLVQRIQAFGRRDAPTLSNQLLRPMVEEVLALVEVASPAGVTLQSRLTDSPLRVMADATQLHQVLMNLCTNAWQALQGAPGTVTVGLEEIRFSDDVGERPPGLLPGPHAHLWVRDTGCGIPADVRDRLFEPFFTTKSARGGTGLGLSMVHGIVTAHRGSLSVESTPGQGACFHVYLPILGAPEAAPQRIASPAANSRPGSGERILYIDDDEVVCVMVERLLARAGFRVSCHASAKAALAEVQRDPAAVDLVVTDFNMPELSGLEVSRQLVTLRPALPVLIISGHISDELPGLARRAGVRGLVQKQNVLEELVPALLQALREPAGPAPAAAG